jgi:hypothetical protein
MMAYQWPQSHKSLVLKDANSKDYWKKGVAIASPSASNHNTENII